MHNEVDAFPPVNNPITRYIVILKSSEPTAATMNATEKRSHAQELIGQLDEEFFSAIYTLMESHVRQAENKVVGYTATGNPVRVSEFLQQAEEQVRKAKTGEGISVSELKKQSDAWLERTR